MTRPARRPGRSPRPTAGRSTSPATRRDEIVEIDRARWTRDPPLQDRPRALQPRGHAERQAPRRDAQAGRRSAVFDLAHRRRASARLKSSTTVTHGVAISPDSRYAFVSSEGVGAAPGKVDVYDLMRWSRVGVGGRRPAGERDRVLEDGGFLTAPSSPLHSLLPHPPPCSSHTDAQACDGGACAPGGGSMRNPSLVPALALALLALACGEDPVAPGPDPAGGPFDRPGDGATQPRIGVGAFGVLLDVTPSRVVIRQETFGFAPGPNLPDTAIRRVPPIGADWRPARGSDRQRHEVLRRWRPGWARRPRGRRALPGPRQGAGRRAPRRRHPGPERLPPFHSSLRRALRPGTAAGCGPSPGRDAGTITGCRRPALRGSGLRLRWRRPPRIPGMLGRAIRRGRLRHP